MAGGFYKRNKVWTSQPQQLTNINWSNPLTTKLKYFWANFSGSRAIESVTGIRNGVFGTTSSYGFNQQGVALKADGNTTGLVNLSVGAAPYPTPTSGELFTLFASVYFDSIVGTQRFYSSGFNNSLSFYLTSTGLLGLATRYGTVIGTSTGALSVKTWYNVAVSWDGTTATFYIDGVASGTGTTVPASYNLTPGSQYLLGDSDGDRTRTGGMLQMFGIYDKILNADEVYRLHQNPWQLFAPQRRMLFAPAAAVGGGFQAAWAIRKTRTIGAGVI